MGLKKVFDACECVCSRLFVAESMTTSALSLKWHGFAPKASERSLSLALETKWSYSECFAADVWASTKHLMHMEEFGAGCLWLSP